jgi:cytochrome P450
MDPFRFGKQAVLPPLQSSLTLAAHVEPFFDPVFLPYTLCAIATLLATVWWAWPPKLRRLPGFPEVPGRLPIIGHGHLLTPERFTEQCETWLDEFGGEDGVCECAIGDTRYVIVGGHAAVMELMRQRPFKVRRNDNMRTAKGIVTLFHAEGDEWRVHRRIFSPSFSQAHMEAYLPVVKEVAERLVNLWRSGPGFDLRDGKAVAQPINQALTELTADTTSLVAFDFDLDSLRTKVSEPHSRRCQYGVVARARAAAHTHADGGLLLRVMVPSRWRCDHT